MASSIESVASERPSKPPREPLSSVDWYRSDLFGYLYPDDAPRRRARLMGALAERGLSIPDEAPAIDAFVLQGDGFFDRGDRLAAALIAISQCRVFPDIVNTADWIYRWGYRLAAIPTAADNVETPTS